MIYNPWELDPLGDMENVGKGVGKRGKKFPIKILARGAGGGGGGPEGGGASRRTGSCQNYTEKYIS